MGAVVTYFMVFTIVSFWGIIALLWCFKGFSRELARGRRHNRLVRVEQVSRVESKTERKKIRAIEFERRTPPQIESREAQYAEAKSEAHKLRAASVIAVAILLGSR
jgi:Na+/melibiose symporter-like transporter